MPTLLEAFDDIPDPRMARTRRHSLRDILVLSVLAVICGADGFVQIEDFGKAKEEWLRELLDLPNGIPSHDTIGRVFSMLSPETFAGSFMRWVGTVAEMVDDEVVAIDGKTVRRSKDGANNRGPIHLVNAWATANRMVLGQVATSEKSNEITAIPELLAALALKGCIVTIDAMGCQKSIAADIIKAEADYVLALKDNHPTLHHEVQGFFEDGILTDFDGIPHSFHEESSQAHDRDEVRKVWTSSDLDWLPEAEEWSGMNSLVCVEAHRTALGKETSVHRRTFLSSIPDLAAKEAARIVRAHWQIENGLHFVLDIAFREGEEGPRRRKPRHRPQHRPQPSQAGDLLQARHQDQEAPRRLGSSIPTEDPRRLDAIALVGKLTSPASGRRRTAAPPSSTDLMLHGGVGDASVGDQQVRPANRPDLHLPDRPKTSEQGRLADSQATAWVPSSRGESSSEEHHRPARPYRQSALRAPRKERDPVAGRRFQVGWLAAQGKSSNLVVGATGYRRNWVFQIVKRYSVGGKDARADKREHDGGHGRIINDAKLAARAQRLGHAPPHGGLWTSPNVAAWVNVEFGLGVDFKLAWETP